MELHQLPFWVIKKTSLCTSEAVLRNKKDFESVMMFPGLKISSEHLALEELRSEQTESHKSATQPDDRGRSIFSKGGDDETRGILAM
jgi:hypothetical protein